MNYTKDIYSLLDYAKNEALNIHKGEEFLLKDLFKGYEWNRIQHKNRLLVGTLFLQHINDTPGSIIAF